MHRIKINHDRNERKIVIRYKTDEDRDNIMSSLQLTLALYNANETRLTEH